MWWFMGWDRIVKLVRALRRGWIKREGAVVAKEPETYLMWDDDLQAGDKTSAGTSLPTLIALGAAQPDSSMFHSLLRAQGCT